MDLLGVSSEGQPRTLQKASMGPVSSRQASCEDTPPDTGDLSWVLLVTIHSHGTPSLHVQLKTHTHLSCICSCICSLSCPAIVLKVPCFSFPRITVLRYENLTPSPSDTSEAACPCSSGGSAPAGETKLTLVSSWETEQGSK